MKSLTLSSPAKLNLFLKIVNKRADGFHNIETIFERIDLCDRIKIASNNTGEIRIRCKHPHVPTGAKNLVYKVAKQLLEDFDLSYGVDISIEKNIPVAAGLAGGSSNAATVLMGLNQLWQLNLSKQKLLYYARQIGSDVAFFLYDCSFALGTERGDKIKKLPVKTKLWHVIVVPRIQMFSWKVYGELRLRPQAVEAAGGSGRPKRSSNRGGTNLLTKVNDNANILIHHLRMGHKNGLGTLLQNDLQESIVRICPKLLKLKQRLNSFDTKGVLISGSGPSVFGITETRIQALEIQSQLLKRFKQVFVARTV